MRMHNMTNEELINHVEEKIQVLEENSEAITFNPALARVSLAIHLLQKKKYDQLIESVNNNSNMVSKQNSTMILLTVMLTIFTLVILIFGGIELWDKFLR